MLRYKRIKENRFLNTFFTIKRAGTVTDKRFVYIGPVNSRKDALAGNDVESPSGMNLWANKAEPHIDNLSGTVIKIMKHSNCPLVQDYCVERRANINYRTTNVNVVSLNGTIFLGTY